MLRSVLAALLVLAAAPVAAQGFSIFNDRNHPEIDWRVAETEHFQIVYPGMANDLIKDEVLLKLKLDAKKS